MIPERAAAAWVGSASPTTWSQDVGARLIVVCSNAAILAVLWFVHTTGNLEPTLWVYGIAQVVLYTGHVLYLRRFHEFDLLDGLNIVHLGFFFHFTLAPFLLHYGLMPAFYASLWDGRDFGYSLLVTHLVSVAVQAGYYLNTLEGGSPRLLRGQISTRRLVAFSGFVVVVWLVVQVPLPFEIASLRAFGGIYLAAMTIAIYAPYLLIILKRPRTPFLAACVIVGGAVYAALASLLLGIGSKAGVASLILAIVMHRHYLVRRLGARAIVLAVIGGVSVTVYMNYMRAVGYVAGIEADAINPLSPDNWETFLAAGVASMLTPFEALMVVLRTFPGLLPYQGGVRLMEEMLYPLAPRAFFPEKPGFYGAAFFWEYHQEFLTLENPIYEAISLPGHFYIDFGLPGVIAGGFLVGWLQRLVYARLITGNRTPATVCLYAILSGYAIVAARAFFWTTQAVIVALLGPMLVVRLLLRRRARPEGDVRR